MAMGTKTAGSKGPVSKKAAGLVAQRLGMKPETLPVKSTPENRAEEAAEEAQENE